MNLGTEEALLRHKAPRMRYTLHLDLLLETLRRAHGPNLLPIKENVALKDNFSSPAVIHGVQHAFHSPEHRSNNMIVFILCELNRLASEPYRTPLPDPVKPAAYHRCPLAPPKEASSLKAHSMRNFSWMNSSKWKSTALRQQFDKWLWFARVTRTRSLAAQLIAGGFVRINAQRVKTPAKAIGPGHVLTVALDYRVRVLKMKSLGARRAGANVSCVQGS